MSTTPRIYVACLAAYNAGKLHGAWIDATDADDMDAATKEMLSKSPEAGAEEWAIHDYEGFEGVNLGESESFETVAKVAALIEEHGVLLIKVADHLNGGTDFEEAAEYLEEHYAGEFQSLEDWAAETLEESGQLNDVPKSLRGYIDFEKWARDAELGGDVFTIETGFREVHVFWNR